MRAVLLADLEQGARALLARPNCDWPDLAALMIAQARLADKYRKRTGRAHPDWGNGTLHDRAIRLPRAPIRYPTPEGFHNALSVLLQTYIASRHQNR